jgi:manganese/iron transport system permease protein
MILTTLLEPFQFSFMVNALVISTIVAVPCALLSVFLVLKGWALMGDAMSHAVFQGSFWLGSRASRWQLAHLSLDCSAR